MNLNGIARFASDPTVVKTTNSQVCKFSLVFNEVIKSASGDKKEIPSFLRFEAWDKGGELISKYFKKGDPIHVVSATPRQDTWEKDGVKRETVYFRLNKFEFLPLNQKKTEQVTEEVPPASGDNGEQEVPF
jgi:single-stranded DNA-binding protein